jgi:hypothetical protein
MTIETDPRRETKKRRDGYIVAEQRGDTEYDDIETGLSWIDMDCVDCCRVSNTTRRAVARLKTDVKSVNLTVRFGHMAAGGAPLSTSQVNKAGARPLLDRAASLREPDSPRLRPTVDQKSTVRPVPLSKGRAEPLVSEQLRLAPSSQEGA